MLPRPPISTLFPYTTLFRSSLSDARVRRDDARKLLTFGIDPSQRRKAEKAAATIAAQNTFGALAAEYLDTRSEEHTSELQSHVNLVCRLLLEKKKKIKIITTIQSITKINLTFSFTSNCISFVTRSCTYMQVIFSSVNTLHITFYQIICSYYYL